MSGRVGRKISILTFALAFFAISGLFFVKSALAATGTIYITPASNSVQNGSTLTVSVRVNPGTTIDSVQGTVTYDASKLQFISVDTSGSAFSTELQNSQSSGSVVFARGDFGAGVSADALIEKISFKALVGSGSGTLGLTGANADAGGTFTNPSSTGASVSFTTPPATCPAGQTGTPPNCTTPTPPGGGSTGGGSSGGGSSGGGSSSGGSHSGGGSGSGGSTGGGSTGTGGNTDKPVCKVNNVRAFYTKAEISMSTSKAAQVYIKYGLDPKNLSFNTAPDGTGTSHSAVLDPATLIPGQTYYYVAVSKDASGNTSETTVNKLQTKGLKVTVGVFDVNHKPLRNKTVTLHSTPQTAKTDANGFVTFDNVSPGDHHVVYAAGKKSYDQSVGVVNNVQTTGDSQSAAAQSFSVVYGFAQSSLSIPVWVWLCVIVLIFGGVVALAQTGRLGMALQLRRRQDYGLPLTSQPVVVGGASRPTDAYRDVGSPPNNPVVQDHLNAIPDPNKPQPGVTIAPAETEDRTKDEN